MSSKTNPHVYDQLIFEKGATTIERGEKKEQSRQEKKEQSRQEKALTLTGPPRAKQ